MGLKTSTLNFFYVAAQGADNGKSPYGPPTLPYVDSLQKALDFLRRDGEPRIEVVRIETSEFVKRVQNGGAQEPYVVWPYYRSRPPGTEEHPDAFSVMGNLATGFVINNVCTGDLRLGDKSFDYQKANEHGISTPETVLLDNANDLDVKLSFSYPIVIKGYPSGRGLDVHLCESVEDAKSADQKCRKKGLKVVAQEYISCSHGRDLRVLVVGGKIVLTLGRQAAFGDFKSNISCGGTYIENPQLSDANMALIQQVIDTFPMDVAGIDFLYTEGGGLVFNEINYAPGWSGLAEQDMVAALAMLVRTRLQMLNVF